MIRRIIKIDTEKCTGCGLCVDACHEKAIAIQNGKAVLLRDDYCDGLGACLPACPENALLFEDREALAFDEQAVAANLNTNPLPPANPAPSACQGVKPDFFTLFDTHQWPVQLQIVPVKSPRFDKVHLLIAADCAAYATEDFKKKFLQQASYVIACPKLDPVDYTPKLAEILKNNDILSVSVVRMSVPCCGGLEHAVRQALAQSGKDLPLTVVQIAPNGQILG